MPTPPMAMDSRDAFRHVMSLWASGVSVVTSRGRRGPEGLTVSSFTSVSLEPRLVLCCIHRGSSTLDAVEESGAFAVNVLSTDQFELGRRFAGLVDGVTDRFYDVDHVTGATGSPILAGSLASLDCRLWRLDAGGDHVIVVGEVVTAEVGTGAPLLYQARSWRQLADAEPGWADAIAMPGGPH